MKSRLATATLIAAAGALALTACSSSSGGGSSSASASKSDIGSPSPTKEGGLCSESAITEAANQVQSGSKVEHFECVKTATGEIAAVAVTAGGITKSIFLQDEANQWVLVNHDVCNDEAAKSNSKFQEICNSN